MAGLFDDCPAEPRTKKARAQGRKKGGYYDEVPAGTSGLPDLETLDPVIYGCKRPVSGECLDYLRDEMGDEAFELWKLRSLPFTAVYRAEDFTEAAQVAILRRRKYSDTEIAAMYPRLKEALAAS